ncbi:MAG: YdcF family protein [Pseudomonadota bacterium]
MLEVLTRVFLMPPTSMIVLILAGLALRRRWPRAGLALSVGAALLLVVLSTTAGALLLIRPLEGYNPPLVPGQTGGAQAIVVLAAGSIEHAPEYGGADMPDQVAMTRVLYAAHLQRRTGLPLLVSGGQGDSARKVEPKARVMARVLRDEFNIPVQWIEERSDTTATNASLSAPILKAAGIKRVLLVTHAMHMERARRSFEHHGIEVVAAPTMFYSRTGWSPWWLMPTASGLYRSYYASHEWVGLLWYKLHALPA